MTASHPLAPDRSQPSSHPQVGRIRRGSGSVIVVACLAAAGVVTGAIYAVRWRMNEAASTAHAAAARSEAHHAHGEVKAPVVEAILTLREEMIEHPITEEGFT